MVFLAKWFFPGLLLCYFSGFVFFLGVFSPLCLGRFAALLPLASCVFLLHRNSDAGSPATKGPDPPSAAHWLFLGYPSLAGSRPWDRPVRGRRGGGGLFCDPSQSPRIHDYDYHRPSRR